LLVLFEVSTVRENLVLYLLPLGNSFEFHEGSLAINRLAFLLALLFLTKLFKFLFRILLSILGLWVDFIIVSLHLINLFVSLFADLNFVYGSRETWGDSETEFTDFLEITNTVLGKKGLASF
jgi:hypothetical protein